MDTKAEVESLRASAVEAKKAKALKEVDLPNGMTALVFRVTEVGDDEQEKTRVAVVINPSAKTKAPRQALSGLIEEIAGSLPDGLKVPKGKDMQYLGEDGKGARDTGAIIIDPGKMTLSVAIEKVNEKLKGMADPERAAVEELKRGTRGTQGGGARGA